jgi:hypothetical protein
MNRRLGGPQSPYGYFREEEKYKDLNNVQILLLINNSETTMLCFTTKLNQHSGI